MRRVIVLLILLFSVSFVLAEGNLTSKEVATACLNESAVILQDVAKYNISLNRFNDSLTKAQDLYSAQLIIETRRGSKPNYGIVISYCDQIKTLKQDAITALDSYRVFLSFYHETIDKNVNSSSIDAITSQIDAEIAGERYDGVPRLIDQGYAEITKVKSEQTALMLAYNNTARGVVGFLKENWIALISVFGLLMAFYLFYRTKISLWLLQRKLSNLLLRKNTLKDLMSKTQRDYFQFGSIPEATYRMRIKNFGELVRDIDRQIPLLQKEIAKYSFEKKEYEKLKESDRDRARLGRTD
ncbi:MAG: hypothetical protein WCI72_06640 [archaeon]